MAVQNEIDALQVAPSFDAEEAANHIEQLLTVMASEIGAGGAVSDREWTRRVLGIVCGVGRKRYNLEVRATDPAYVEAHCGEWLYDAICIERGNGTFRTRIVVESEWARIGGGGVEDDFEKLLVARSDLRLMVFQGHEDEIDAAFPRLQQRAHSLQPRGQEPSLFHFAGLNWDNRPYAAFKFHRFWC